MDYTAIIILSTCIFTIIQTTISIGYLSKKKYPFLIENIVIYFLYLIYLFVQHKFRLYVEWYLIIFIIITVVGHVLIGEYFDAYKKVGVFDRALHAFGTFSFALFTYSLIYKTIKPTSYPEIYTIIFIINLGISLGVFFELLEFSIDSFFKTESQSGLTDTNVDLIADIIGSVIAGFTYTFFIH